MELDGGGQLYALDTLARGKSPRYPLDRGWVGPTAGLEAVAKRKNPTLSLPGIEP